MNLVDVLSSSARTHGAHTPPHPHAVLYTHTYIYIHICIYIFTHRISDSDQGRRGAGAVAGQHCKRFKNDPE